RLWVASNDYFEDVRIGPQILQGQIDSYRKIRNTFRFLLGNLGDFEESEVLPVEQMPELERWVLNRLFDLDQLIRGKANDYDFNAIYQALYNFCVLDLSSFYFDIRKDCLYCDARNSTKRRAARTVLNHLFDCLTAWFAPILAFTAEEVWKTRMGEDAGSVHERLFPEIPQTWHNADLAGRWQTIRKVRRVVTGALEVDRRNKAIGSSLEAAVIIYVEDEGFKAALEGVDFMEISITSGAGFRFGKAPKNAFRLAEVKEVAVVTARAKGGKCGRCWMVLEEVGGGKKYKDLCKRCADVVAALPDARERT
ncbi:MAG: class I tRNA ligase family protein, partial [Proteobacteria bacterium]|nr:class I tRNA ligase family protein [Pseudomonadota bacterium]